MSSRGQISARQRNITYRPNGCIAQHVLDATIEFESSKSVALVRFHEATLIGQAVVQAEQQAFLVASKFSNRYYLVVINKGIWQCSSKDEAVSRMCIGRAQQFRAELIAAKAEKANQQKLNDFRIGDSYEQLSKAV